MEIIGSKLFDYFAGNHRLTEDIIYNQQPNDEDSKIPIFSGSNDNICPIDYISDKAKNKDGEEVKYFKGPCLILTKDGSAGLLTYKDSEEKIFTINHHACILKLKKEQENKVLLKWFAYQYRKKLYKYISSKSDNGVFSIEWLDKVIFNIPDKSIQEAHSQKKEFILEAINSINILNSKISFLLYTTKLKGEIGPEEYIKTIFSIKGGNSGLTEEFIYNNQPTDDSEKVQILSGATIFNNMMGYISINSMPNYKKLKLFQGPAIVVIRKGIAGKMTYIQNGKFTINDDAYVITPKKDWKDRIDLRWFTYQYQELFFNLVTSKSDNATFNKEYIENQKIKILDINIQKEISDKLKLLDKTIDNLEDLKEKFTNLLETEIII